MMWTVCLGLLLAGHASLWGLAGLGTRDRRLRIIVSLSFAIRWSIALIFFLASAHHWPLMRGSQLGGGFWTFGLDSRIYHEYAVRIADAWRHGVELPNPELGFEYFAVVAGVYRVLGAQPLYAILLNCWAATLTGVLAYHLGRRMADARIGLWSSAVVSFWPSSLLWSSQLLKDALSWLLIFGLLCAICACLDDMRRGDRATLRAVGWMLASAALTALATRYRVYIGSATVVAAMVVLVPSAVLAWRRQRRGVSVATLALAGLLTGTVIAARSIDSYRLLSCPHPSTGHYHLGMSYWQRGALHEAEDELRKATADASADRSRWLQLATLKLYQGQLPGAIDAYAAYLAQSESNPPLSAKQALALVQLVRGDEALAADRSDDALQAYREALTTDHTIVLECAHRARLLAERSQDELSLRLLQLVEATSPVPTGALQQALADAYLLNADAQTSSDRMIPAIHAYDHALTLDPSVDLAHRSQQRAGITCAALIDRLQRMLTTTLPREDRATTGRVLVRLYEQRGDEALAADQLSVATAAYQQAIALNPHASACAIKLGMVLARVRNFTAALEVLNRASSASPTSSSTDGINQLMARIELDDGDAQAGDGQIASAINRYRHALARDPSVQPLVLSRVIELARHHHVQPTLGFLEDLARPTPPPAPIIHPAPPPPAPAVVAPPTACACRHRCADAACACRGRAPTACACRHRCADAGCSHRPSPGRYAGPGSASLCCGIGDDPRIPGRLASQFCLQRRQLAEGRGRDDL